MDQIRTRGRMRGSRIVASFLLPSCYTLFNELLSSFFPSSPFGHVFSVSPATSRSYIRFLVNGFQGVLRIYNHECAKKKIESIGCRIKIVEMARRLINKKFHIAQRFRIAQWSSTLKLEVL